MQVLINTIKLPFIVRSCQQRHFSRTLAYGAESGCSTILWKHYSQETTSVAPKFRQRNLCNQHNAAKKKSTMFAARKHRRAFGLVRCILTQKSFSGLCTASTSVSVKHYSSALERIPPEFHV